MLLSVNWLRELVPFEGEIETLADRLTMLGLEVEEIAYPYAGLSEVVVGKVLTRDQHPEADKLSVCTVDIGEGEVASIVCGAPNVAAGRFVPVAPVGSTLPGGLKIKKAKLRGVASNGMICSERELELGEDHDGIMLLDGEFTPGQRFVDVMGLNDVVLDLGITPNRADCLSVLGVAREVALAFDLPLTLPTANLTESGGDADSLFSIQIDDSELCPVYRSRLIDGVTVGKSPSWIRYRLMAVGQRPVSNVVDVTNYVLMELGQPLHAFDRDLLEGGKIRVAPAENGMKFTTLDGQERTLTDQDLLIWDGVKPVGLAGVMGGANSEMNDGSSKVLLESAVFRPGTIRRTARKLGLSSEASYRFERGVDHVVSQLALQRAAALIAQTAGGQVLSGEPTAEPKPWKAKPFVLRPERARQLLGVDLDQEFCRKTMVTLGCELDESDGESWRVTPPSHRLDLEREVDAIEELGRVYGLDRIQATLPSISRSLDSEPMPDLEGEYEFFTRLKRWGMGAGLREAVNYSFVGHKDLDTLGLPAEGRIPVKNPLTEEQNVMRPVLAPGLMQNVRTNVAQGNDRIRLFEVAHVFSPDAQSSTTAKEPVRLGVLLYGPRDEETWPWPPNQAQDHDYLDLKGLIEHLLRSFKLPPAVFEMADMEAGEPEGWRGHWPGHCLNPCVHAMLDGELLAVLGRVRPDMADPYHGRKDVWLAELDVDLLRRRVEAATILFDSLPTYPPSRRDLTLTAPANVTVGAVLEQVGAVKAPLLESSQLIDVYVPEGEEADRNLTFRFTFRHCERTLKDKEVDKEMSKLSKALEKALPIRF